ncbi:alpha/beta fold hydrolase [Azospirillum picis]|uniref:N-formylmaleamate deformylase n=1 Tax=Azospirillum picis TaxID=488438 RepID=A0ABU0MUY0_9PROT|nr:alpha/beta hydrolase [Azospirillum picis]MBP2303394.1 N-formylmaleamate deformylase [Azospirillum picis]MDQ0537280.1 N-formylmaleamate deformylase [Azospirillum picis]
MTGRRLLYGANVHANGIRQHYLRYGGTGTPLILVPGITSPAVTWGFVAERLGERFDVHVLDVRGRGLSEAGPELDYGLDAMADDVAAFAATLGLRDYVLLGHSMGARVAVRMRRRHADAALGRILLVDPPVSGPGRRPYPAQLGWYIDSMRLARQGADWQAMRPFLPGWSEEQLRLRAEWLHTCSEEAVTATYHGFHDDDIHVDVPYLDVPTLLVVAGKAGVILPEDEAELRTLLPSLRVERVEGAGHMIPWDDFGGFFAAIDPFLDAAQPGRHDHR